MYQQSEILNGRIPIQKILHNSLYYPASEFDGQIIKFTSKDFQNFVYCDYSCEEDQFVERLNSFNFLYKILAHRKVSFDEIFPNYVKGDFSISLFDKHKLNALKPFAHWAVMDLIDKRKANTYSEQFSLLFICGDGVTTYKELYTANHTSAKALAIIQPGAGFGNNWTDFRDPNSHLAKVVLKNKYGSPDYIFYGGNGDDYEDLNWPDYIYIRTIKPYYSSIGHVKDKPSGKLTIWSKGNI